MTHDKHTRRQTQRQPKSEKVPGLLTSQEEIAKLRRPRRTSEGQRHRRHGYYLRERSESVRQGERPVGPRGDHSKHARSCCRDCGMISCAQEKKPNAPATGRSGRKCRRSFGTLAARLRCRRAQPCASRRETPDARARAFVCFEGRIYRTNKGALGLWRRQAE